MDNKKFAIELASCELEEEIILCLQQRGMWDNSECWKAFGDNENNWSTIGNQQSEPEPALVEKIVNSVDALLMKECLIRGIKPDSSNAPVSVKDALEQYFHVKNGKITDITQSQRTTLAKNIILTATGKKPDRNKSGRRNCPTLTLVDKGEGQSPRRMPETILSINKSNKLKVPFVQGKFNMGGTGVLRFCGQENIQLIISKRCPDIVEINDSTNGLWGVTVVRREKPKNGRRSSVFTYLTDDKGEIISFEAESLEIIPSSDKMKKKMEYGMFCKMFEYELPSRMCSNINMSLYNRLSTLLPNLAYPIMLEECREYKGNTMFRTLSGLNVRLSDQRANGEDGNIEESVSANFTIDNQKISAVVYVFKKKTKQGTDVDVSQFRADEGIILVQNGQTHGNFDRKFYRRNSVGLSYLADSLLTIVDCSNIDEITREELFMNSRDRMRAGGFAGKLEQELESFLKENEVLKSLQSKRREEAISNRLDNEKPLEDVLESVFKSSTVLSKIFIVGERLKNPNSMGKGGIAEQFLGKVNPTFFTLCKKSHGKYIKQAQVDRKFRIKIKTDANNDFFSKIDFPGEYKLECGEIESGNHRLNLRDGIVTLNIELPKNASIGDKYSYSLVFIDTMVEREFEEEFDVVVVAQQETVGGSGKRHLPPGNNNDKHTFSPQGIALPNVIEVTHEKWNDYEFTKESSMIVKVADSEKNIYDFYINMENIHLQTELKPLATSPTKIKLYKARYKYGMVLLGLSIISASLKDDATENDVIEDTVKSFSNMISPILLPMIDVMGDDMEDIING